MSVINLNKAVEQQRQIIPVIIMVERGFSDENIIDWLEGSLNNVFSCTEFRRLVTVYSRKVEEIYGHICLNSDGLRPDELLEYLAPAPQPIMGLRLGWS